MCEFLFYMIVWMLVWQAFPDFMDDWLLPLLRGRRAATTPAAATPAPRPFGRPRGPAR
jgi:hypothetical protein